MWAEGGKTFDVAQSRGSLPCHQSHCPQSAACVPCQFSLGYKFQNMETFTQVGRFGLAVRRLAGKRKDLGSIPLRLSFLFKMVVVCGHCPVTLPVTSY